MTGLCNAGAVLCDGGRRKGGAVLSDGGQGKGGNFYRCVFSRKSCAFDFI